MPTYIITCILLTFLSYTKSEIASVSIDEYGNAILHKGIFEGRVASAVYQNVMNKTGWSYLEVDTVAGTNDKDQAYAAGYIEGSITREMIAMHWHNTYEGYCTVPLSGFCSSLQQYINDNLEWTQSMIDKHAKTDNYWHQVQLFYDQIMGIYDGFYLRKQKFKRYHIFVTDINIMQISGDIETLAQVLNGQQHHQHHQDVAGKGRVLGSGHCSAIVKLLGNNSDIYAGQNTWTGYNAMLRVLKKYNLHYHNITDNSMISGNVASFSSAPVSITSGDDFYVIEFGLSTMETTIGNSNPKNWKYVKPQNLLQCTRNIVANRLAKSALEWCQIFEKFNMGTYNNEWMIIDYGKFENYQKPLAAGTFFVLDQIPGMIVYKDLTLLLESQRYFASYNSPHFPSVFIASGIQQMVNRYGDWFSYDKSPRALIFKREQGNVQDLQTMAALMSYNRFQTDPLSRCNCTPPYSAENSIAARCDLNPPKGVYPFSALGHRNHGAIDYKFTCKEMSTKLEFISRAGPTHTPLPVFDWTTSDLRNTVPHLGQPNRWHFQPVLHNWNP